MDVALLRDLLPRPCPGSMKPIIILALSLALACSSDSGPDSAQADATILGNPDAANSTVDAMAATPDARPSPDANLSVHAFVDVDGSRLDFDDVSVFDGSLNSRTIVAEVGTDCPLSATCTELYVSFPQDTQPGFKTCDDSQVTVQLSLGTDRYFSFGSAAAFCGFTLELNDGDTVAVTGLNARVEQTGGSAKTLTAGELRGAML